MSYADYTLALLNENGTVADSCVIHALSYPCDTTTMVVGATSNFSPQEKSGK